MLPISYVQPSMAKEFKFISCFTEMSLLKNIIIFNYKNHEQNTHLHIKFTKAKTGN